MSKYTTACAIVENATGQILLIKRGRDPFKGSWALISGIGESKKGIPPDVGIVGEVRWDIGTDTFRGERLFALPIDDDPYTDELVVFLGHIDPRVPITMRPGFSFDYKWVDRTDTQAFKNLAFEHPAIIQRYLELDHKNIALLDRPST